jgi:hypothetical protein
LEQVEYDLISLAHDTSMIHDNDALACQGRALKAFVPAWINFLRSERARNASPGHAVHALVKVAAMLTSLIAVANAKPDGRMDVLVEHLCWVFHKDLMALLPENSDASTKH